MSPAVPGGGSNAMRLMATTWDPDDMKKVAFHEAGHAVVMWLLGIPLKHIRLDLEKEGGGVEPDVDAKCAARLIPSR